MRRNTVAVVLGFLLIAALPMSSTTAKQASKQEGKKPPKAVRIATKHFGVNPDTIRVTDMYTSDHNEVTHVYLRQVKDGADVVGADANVNIQKGEVIFSGSRFVKPENVSGVRRLDAAAAQSIALSVVQAADAQITQAPTLAYRVLENGTARLAYDVRIATQQHWWNISVDAETGDVIHRYDLVDSENTGDIAAQNCASRRRTHRRSSCQAHSPAQQAKDGSSYNVFAMPTREPERRGADDRQEPGRRPGFAVRMARHGRQEGTGVHDHARQQRQRLRRHDRRRGRRPGEPAGRRRRPRLRPPDPVLRRHACWSIGTRRSTTSSTGTTSCTTSPSATASTKRPATSRRTTTRRAVRAPTTCRPRRRTEAVP